MMNRSRGSNIDGHTRFKSLPESSDILHHILIHVDISCHALKTPDMPMPSGHIGHCQDCNFPRFGISGTSYKILKLPVASCSIMILPWYLDYIRYNIVCSSQSISYKDFIMIKRFMAMAIFISSFFNSLKLINIINLYIKGI